MSQAASSETLLHVTEQEIEVWRLGLISGRLQSFHTSGTWNYLNNKEYHRKMFKWNMVKWILGLISSTVTKLIRAKGQKKQQSGSDERKGESAGVYQLKWLFLSAQLKGIKGLVVQPCNTGHMISLTWSGLSLLLSSFSSILLSLILFMLVSQLSCYSIKATVLLLCIPSELPTRFANTSALSRFHVKKIRRADWFVFVSRCSMAATAIGNP